jgi:hypothetical protein
MIPFGIDPVGGKLQDALRAVFYTNSTGFAILLVYDDPSLRWHSYSSGWLVIEMNYSDINTQLYSFIIHTLRCGHSVNRHTASR